MKTHSTVNTDPTHYDQNVSNREIWGTHTITTTTKRTINTKRTQRVLRFVKAPLQTALNELRPWRYVDADFKRGKYFYMDRLSEHDKERIWSTHCTITTKPTQTVTKNTISSHPSSPPTLFRSTNLTDCLETGRTDGPM